MKRSRFMILAIFVTLLILLLTPFMWLRSWKAEVKLNGSTIRSARVYRDHSGNVLIDLRNSVGDLYVVNTSEKDIGIPNDYFPVKTPAIIFAREHPVKIVPLSSVKIGPIADKLSVTPLAIKFNLSEKDTIEVLMY
jgi:hypothetical protein